MLREFKQTYWNWIILSGFIYVIWVMPDWDGSWSSIAIVGQVARAFHFLGRAVDQNPFGDWRDAAIIIPISALFYTGVSMAITAVKDAARNRPGSK